MQVFCQTSIILKDGGNQLLVLELLSKFGQVLVILGNFRPKRLWNEISITEQY
jgi:hypothetical protein